MSILLCLSGILVVPGLFAKFPRLLGRRRKFYSPRLWTPCQASWELAGEGDTDQRRVLCLRIASRCSHYAVVEKRTTSRDLPFARLKCQGSDIAKHVPRDQRSQLGHLARRQRTTEHAHSSSCAHARQVPGGWSLLVRSFASVTRCHRPPACVKTITCCLTGGEKDITRWTAAAALTRMVAASFARKLHEKHNRSVRDPSWIFFSSSSSPELSSRC